MACLGWIGCRQSEPGSNIVIRYAHTGVAGETQTRFVEDLARQVHERTSGKITIQVFPNSQLGNTSEMIDGVKTGIIGMSHHDFALLGKLLDDMSVFNVPYLYRDGAHSLQATDPRLSPVMQELNAALIEKAGMRVLGSFYRGARQLTANYPVRVPADLQGKKIRAIPLKVWMSMIKGMGAIPTPVEMPEVAVGLMTGVISGQENPLSNIMAHKLFEVQSHVIMTSHIQAATCVFVNEETWRKIEPADQALIKSTLDELSQQTLEWEALVAREYKTKLQEKGMVFIDESDGLDLSAFKEAVGAQITADFPEWDGYIKRINDIP